jgi:glutamate-ammonia-ligase adenylyltransferase
MDALAASFVAGLERGTVDQEALHRVGESEPQRAAAAFLRAAGDAQLAPSLAIWAPALLRSARPGVGAERLADLVSRARHEGRPPPDPARAPGLAALLGSSSALSRVLLRWPDWWSELAGNPPPAPDTAPPPSDWGAIRRAKYRGLLRIATRDLLERPFAASLRELSDLADACLEAGLSAAAIETRTAPPALLALGKLGGRELNFSSDVDLLFLYPVPPGGDALARNEEVGRLVRHLKSELETTGDEGFAYRVDLDLRPEGRSGVIANSLDAALGYYESFGQEWERQMLIRLRPVAGPPEAGAAFAREISPFVYRRHIDPGVMRSVRDMKARIEDERRRAGRDLEVDLKEGPGGIRDVEFLVQSLQLFYGGGEESLRTGNVLDGLAAIDRLGLLPPETVAALTNAYTWLRRAEHALQLAEEQQVSRLPRERPAQLALARRMGYADPDAETARARLLEDWTSVRTEVRSHFEALVLAEPR